MGLFDGKTEAPTAKRREDARKKGQVAKSRDVISVVVLMAGFGALRAAGPRLHAALQESVIYYLTVAMRPDRQEALQQAPISLVATTMIVLAPLLVAVTVASVVSNVGQTGPMLISEPLKVDLTKLNPVQGFKRMVSPQALAELLKASAKIGIVGWQVYGWMKASYPSILEMAEMDLLSACQFSGERITDLVMRTLTSLASIASIDYTWQRYQHEMQLRMTRQEVKDEFKQSEGSPEIRAAIRRKQRELLRGRMMQAVPLADVVITNPTHYAVALRYVPEEMDAPEVVALGQRLTALRIREIATEHRVPIVENPPLARALFAACDVGSLVPPDLYAAVAEVLAYVYRLTGKSFAGKRRS
ncbi:MAG: flagellar biosynthesis protein FlhB [Armatimonadetes bacterium]|nr:flagellar biosynthesis protein FlhB [Armatimonadota bacterium]